MLYKDKHVASPATRIDPWNNSSLHQLVRYGVSRYSAPGHRGREAAGGGATGRSVWALRMRCADRFTPARPNRAIRRARGQQDLPRERRGHPHRPTHRDRRAGHRRGLRAAFPRRGTRRRHGICGRREGRRGGGGAVGERLQPAPVRRRTWQAPRPPGLPGAAPIRERDCEAPRSEARCGSPMCSLHAVLCMLPVVVSNALADHTHCPQGTQRSCAPRRPPWSCPTSATAASA